MPADDLEEQARRLGPWFHNLHLPDGTETAPDHPLGDFPRINWETLQHLIPDDLTGWRCLDVGCNAGYYTFELARRGADVTGVDLDPRYLRQAAWAADVMGLADRVTLQRRQVYDLAHDVDEPYDLVLFLGVLYHLRYPLLGLDVVAQRTRGKLVLQSLRLPGDFVFEDTAGRRFEDLHELARPEWPRMSFIEHDFAGDKSNWWVPDRACLEAMMRSAGLQVRDRAGDFYLMERTRGSGDLDRWDMSEYLAATGQPWEPAADLKTKPAEGTLERGHSATVPRS